MPTPVEVAEAHYAAQARQAEATAVLSARLWRGMGGDLDGSWARIVHRLTVIVGSAQLGAARAGAAYVPEALDFDPEVLGQVNPSRFAGVASDGRPLDTLLYSAVVRARTHMAGPDSLPAALAAGGEWLDGLVRTQVADAARGAAGVAIAARPRVGYVRHVEAPCCQRCAVLAGKQFRFNEGFLRHPRCFPAGVVASGPSMEAAARRWYEGELVLLTTESGEFLPLTGNHPVLTRRGWIPANLLQEGDEVIRSTQPQGAAPLVVPDHHQVPSLVEDVWGALAVNGFDRVPSTPEDFHGDGQYGEVDVVQADSPLRGGLDSLFAQHRGEEGFPFGVVPAPRFDLERMSVLVDLWDSAHPGGPIGGGDLEFAFGAAHLLGSHVGSVAASASLNTGSGKATGDYTAGDAVLPGEGVFGSSALVLGHQFVNRQSDVSPRWDASASEMLVDRAGRHPGRSEDLLHRLSGQVESDRVVDHRRVSWSGHVYSLTSSEGWLSANNLIVSNCDCRHLPSAEGESPRGYKASVDPDQIRDLTADQRQAIADGADLNQVVNSRRGRDGMTTSEGTTRRGMARQRLDGRQRLTPEGVYRVSATREEAIERLRTNGYLL